MTIKFGFLKIFLLAVLLIAGGAFAWLALVDMPVQQQEINVDVPISGAR